MAIQSQDDLINSFSQGREWRQEWNKQTGSTAYSAGRWYDFSLLNGNPVANTYTGTALAAQAPSDTSGWGIWHGGNVSSLIKSVVNVGGVTTAGTGVPGVLLLVDICLYYPGISINTASAQTLTNSTTLTRYTTGAGLRAFFVVTTASGATAHNIAISYTNQAGTSGRTLPVTVACTASAIVGHMTHTGTATSNYGPFLPLASGDTGVRSVQSVTFSAASGAGAGALVLAKPLLSLPLGAVTIYTERDLLNQLPSLPVIQDGACLAWLYLAGAATAASTQFTGHLQTVWG